MEQAFAAQHHFRVLGRICESQIETFVQVVCFCSIIFESSKALLSSTSNASCLANSFPHSLGAC